MKLNDLEIYQKSMTLGDKVYDTVIKWNYFDKDTLGKQWVRAVDSVSLNISEGFGKYYYKDQRNFYYFSRGSLLESYSCLKKAKNRELIDEAMFTFLFKEHETLTIKLNKFIRSVTNLINKGKETPNN
ncbi:MAG: four helix bundle protein [Bacteroidia bacterium]|nr:four helix bundle protein [Bacteroidia bacterium]